MTTSTTLPALTAPSNAPSCPPEGSTSPGIARRAVLARTAVALGLGVAANVMAVVATKSAPTDQAADPIFAAIDAHRAVWTAYHQVLEHHSKLETEVIARGGKWSTDPGVCAHQDQVNSAWDSHEDAALELIDTLPTTLAGVVALLDYVVEFAVGHSDSWPEKIRGWSDDDDPDDERPFELWMLRSVSLALSDIAKQSGAA